MNLTHCTLAAAVVLAACSSENSTGVVYGSPDSGSESSASSAGQSGTSATDHGSSGASSGITTQSGSSVGATGSSTTEVSSSSSVVTSSSSAGNPGDPEPADMVGMTAAHNSARAAVIPAASPALPQDAWSATVAASAQAFANNCMFADTGPPYGSNAFAGTGTYTPAQVVAAWVGEDADYDYASNSCTPGQQCGHYTQVVWRDSTEIGCGMANCTANNPFGSGTWQLWICNYNPPGNYVGEKPY